MPLPVAVTLLVAALCMWLPDYMRMPELWSSTMGAQSLVALNGILLCMVLYRAKATGHFSLLPALLYIAATGIIPYLRVQWQPQLIAGILLYFLYATRDMTDSHEPNDLVFFVTVLLSLAALLVPDALWCIVFLWIVVLLQGLFTMRTILASVLGVALVTIYYVLAMYMGWAEPFDFSLLIERHWFAHELPGSITTVMAVMLVAFIVVSVSAFQRSSYDLVSTRMLLYHALLIGLLSTPLIVLTPARPDEQVLLPLALSATTGIYLLQKESESRGVTLLLYLAVALAAYLWLLFTL